MTTLIYGRGRIRVQILYMYVYIYIYIYIHTDTLREENDLRFRVFLKYVGKPKKIEDVAYVFGITKKEV